MHWDGLRCNRLATGQPTITQSSRVLPLLPGSLFAAFRELFAELVGGPSYLSAPVHKIVAKIAPMDVLQRLSKFGAGLPRAPFFPRGGGLVQTLLREKAGVGSTRLRRWRAGALSIRARWLADFASAAAVRCCSHGVAGTVCRSFAPARVAAGAGREGKWHRVASQDRQDGQIVASL